MTMRTTASHRIHPTTKTRSCITTLMHNLGGVVILLLLTGGPSSAQVGYECFTPDEPEPELLNTDCSIPASYTPDQSHGYQNTPCLVFKINYHFIRPTDGTGPYQGDLSATVNSEVAGLNWFYDNLDPPSLPVSPAAEYITETRVRFDLNGIYYHDDDARFNHYLNLPDHPQCGPAPRDEFGVDVDEVINIFYYRSATEAAMAVVHPLS